MLEKSFSHVNKKQFFLSANLNLKFLFPGAPSYATAFEPTQESMVVAHHMRLFSCAPGKVLLEGFKNHEKSHS